MNDQMVATRRRNAKLKIKTAGGPDVKRAISYLMAARRMIQDKAVKDLTEAEVYAEMALRALTDH